MRTVRLVQRAHSLGEACGDLGHIAGGPAAPTRADTLPPIPGAIAREDLEEKDWHSVIAANLTTAFLVCREFAPRMKARKFGRIVNFASIAALDLSRAYGLAP